MGSLLSPAGRPLFARFDSLGTPKGTVPFSLTRKSGQSPAKDAERTVVISRWESLALPVLGPVLVRGHLRVPVCGRVCGARQDETVWDLLGWSSRAEGDRLRSPFSFSRLTDVSGLPAVSGQDVPLCIPQRLAQFQERNWPGRGFAGVESGRRFVTSLVRPASYPS